MLLFRRMWDRIAVARESSDSDLFLDLMLLGEMVLKLTASGLIAGVLDERDRHRYRLLHKVVRADGLGDWAAAVDDVVQGPARSHAQPTIKAGEQTELAQRTSEGAWQFESVRLLHSCLRCFEAGSAMESRAQGRQWFSVFAALRNASKGHGATGATARSAACHDLEQSLRLVMENHCLFKRPWALVRRTLSGNYRVTSVTENAADAFGYLRTERDLALTDGLYVAFDRPSQVELIHVKGDALDFYFPNGAFKERQFELLSYLTGDKEEGTAERYLVPPTALPASETAAMASFSISGEVFTNMPSSREGYVGRPVLEAELLEVLSNDRHPVVTLTGPGGIGKTWLTLAVLHQLAQTTRFDSIVWFSARDTDLLPEGPKPVRADVLTDRDIATQFVDLVEPPGRKERSFSATEYMQDALGSAKGELGTLLCVFDNFETIGTPVDAYRWLDTYIRTPNKVLITTRSREFRGDYPVTVHGMTRDEFQKLVNDTTDALGITSLITDRYRADLFRESGGHPYVTKVFLGEVAKTGRADPPERILASQDEILDALFERTYAKLSPAAQRVLLALSGWRSPVPELAVEAVLLRLVDERVEPGPAIQELVQSSFVESSRSEGDGEHFVTVPLAASAFAQKKLKVSPLRAAVEADVELLPFFAAPNRGTVEAGITPRIDRLFRRVAVAMVNGDPGEQYLPILQFVARKHPSAWLRLATLMEESKRPDRLERAKEALRSYLEASETDAERLVAWQRLAQLASESQDSGEELHALIELAQVPSASIRDLSVAANELNRQFSQGWMRAPSDEKAMMFRRLREVMERRADEGDATYFSRLAWLCLNLQDTESARKYALRGVALDPDDVHCKNILRRLDDEPQRRARPSGRWN